MGVDCNIDIYCYIPHIVIRGVYCITITNYSNFVVIARVLQLLLSLLKCLAKKLYKLYLILNYFARNYGLGNQKCLIIKVLYSCNKQIYPKCRFGIYRVKNQNRFYILKSKNTGSWCYKVLFKDAVSNNSTSYSVYT